MTFDITVRTETITYHIIVMNLNDLKPLHRYNELKKHEKKNGAIDVYRGSGETEVEDE